jgi:hypothetical protein
MREGLPGMRGKVPRIVALIALMALAGCADGEMHYGPSASPASGASATCQRRCDSEYDSCMGRFAGVGDPSGFGHGAGDPSAPLGPNNVCPDQLKSCQQRCAP